MKFTFNKKMENEIVKEISVGDVFRVKGGKGDARFWVIVAISDQWNNVKCLGIDENGTIVSVASYVPHAFANRARVGIVEGLDELQLNILPVD